MTEYQAQTAFVFGCGYLGCRVAKLLLSAGWQVGALTRSRQRAAALRGAGVSPVVGNWTDSRVYSRIPPAARVLIAVGYDGSRPLAGGQARTPSRHEVHVEGLRLAMNGIAPESQVVYVSTTGVYHQADGSWVDENSPARPARGGGASHLQAEELLGRERREWGNRAGVVLRMAGLYGPGRVPRAEAIRRGEVLAADPEGYLNLIHIDDAAASVMAAWECESPENMYAISDGNPVIRGRYYEEIATLLDAPRPRYVATLTSGLSQRSDSNKRIWNRRMQRDLLPRCQFPSYREGLRELLKDS